MALHVAPDEHRARIARATARLQEQGLAGLLVFRQESMYWLTGYDTAGYSQFQGLWLGADGGLMLLTRSSDVRQAKLTSIIEDVRLWVDAAGANPAATLREAIETRIRPGVRIGVEYASVTLNAQRGKLLDAAFGADAVLEDASTLIAALAVVKSPAELAHVRQAGRIADEAWRRAFAACRPGASESDILAEIYATVIRAGGDPAAGRFVCGAGDNALLCRYFTGKGRIGETDQVNIEFAAAYRHYHVALMRTALTGSATPAQRRMHDANIEALEACRRKLRPGYTYGDLFDAHAAVLDRHGYRHARLNACGYSLGISYPPTWMEWPMIYAGNPVPLEPNMVVFMHMILLDSETNLAMCLGETFIVTEGEPERLSALSHDLPLVA
ncbi:M24 family metallopeptidase [Plastoroseomonas hellenica]|uniref:M24 family metallopeptidase n=1 Tax=Plastoroseomonas hellenica TaxID=2687306 RepID=UPI001BA606C5|nr:Xaa-Pro peptidase family protein [Plastoroseomonas hellenica]MBR0646359.1 aminopeptidase P family protein [Plastoroseomonas hellenica]